MSFIILLAALAYCVFLSFSWYNAIGYLKYPHSDDFEDILIGLTAITSLVLMFVVGLSVIHDRDVNTNIRITELARVGNKVTVIHNGTEITKVDIDDIKISRNNQDYVKTTDYQKVTNSKIMQAMKGSKILTHDKEYTVYLGNKNTLKDLGIRVHKSNK